MSAVTAFKGMQPRDRWMKTASQVNRELMLCWRELAQLSTFGNSPAELRLKNFIYRCERLS